MRPSPAQASRAEPWRGITRRGLLGAGSAAALAGGLSCAGAPGGRAGGVLLLVADDLGRRDLGAYGNAAVTSPALDRLAAEGLRLDRVYTPTALCRPSRAALLSGLYPHRTGRSWYGDLPAELALWPEHFRAGGVLAGILGKTAELEFAPRWDFCEGGEVGHAKGRDPAYLAASTERFLAAARGRPFTLVVNFYDPHFTDVAALQDPSRLTATRAELARIEPPPFLPGTDEVKVELRNYYRDVARLDAGVAAVLGVLAEQGRAEDTLVVFTSDNGSDFPFAKATLREAGINMPCLVRWPGSVAAGRRSEALISFVDLLPTCLRAMGLATPPGIDGRSFEDLLRGRSAVHREVVFGEHDEHRGETETPSRAVVTAGHKYLRHFRLASRFETASMRTVSWRSMVVAARRDEALARRMRRLQQRPRAELYDLRADPWELEDLAGDADLAALEAGLAERLRGWMRAENDPLLAEWDA